MGGGKILVKWRLGKGRAWGEGKGCETGLARSNIRMRACCFGVVFLFVFFFLFTFLPFPFPLRGENFWHANDWACFCLWRLLFHFFNKQHTHPCLLSSLVFWKFGRFSVCVVWSKNMERQVQLILFIFSFELSWNKRRRQALEDLEAFPVRPLFFCLLRGIPVIYSNGNGHRGKV